MEFNFQQLVAALSISPISQDILQQITILLEQPSEKPFHSLFMLQKWAWQMLSQSADQWKNQPHYHKLFQTLATFNKNLIFNYDYIDAEAKNTLLFSVDVDQIDHIFQQIESSTDDNDSFITIASHWFDNHSHFIYDNPDREVLAITDHINQYIFHNYFMSEQFEFYLNQLRQSSFASTIITARMLFYIKTCLFSLFSYVRVRSHSYPCTAEELLAYIGKEYLEIIHFHSFTVQSWTRDLLECLTHLISFTAACFSWDGVKYPEIKLLFPTEKVLCNHIEDLTRIIDYAPFQQQIKAVRSNDETCLIDGIILMLSSVVYKQQINWFFRCNTNIQNVLISVAEISPSDGICISIYGILGEFLDDEQMKVLKIVNKIHEIFFSMLEIAWHHPLKKYKHISIEHLLRGYSNLTKHDVIQERTASSGKIPLLIEISENYPIVYDILWALSFNKDIQCQLRSNTSFMSNLYQLAGGSNNKQMQKIIHGLLWNLEFNHNDPISLTKNEEKVYDIMISYSHKDKELCKQIYQELIKASYRVWIDFDQMHGNVMDAMAQAIESSKTVIICISEEYRKSNYCRAEAQYAFQRQRKIVPVLLQKQYKPDGWLLFLVGQLLYVDFTKYEFNQATTMLLKEVQSLYVEDTNTQKNDTIVACSTQPIILEKKSTPPILPEKIIDWTSTNVQDWLASRNFNQMSQLLADFDGRSLLYLSQYMNLSNSQQILLSFREDALRRLNQHLSFIELSRFQSLMEQYRQEKMMK